MKKTIFFKLFTGYFLLAIILSILILVVSFKTIRDNYINTLTVGLRNLGTVLEDKITPFLEEKNFHELDTLVKKSGKKIDTRITVIGNEGVVLADSKKDPRLMENHSNRPELIKALNGRTGESIRYSSTVKEEMLYVALPIKSDGEILGAVRVSLFLKDINSLLNTLKKNILQITAFIVFLALLGALLFSKRLVRPIRELSSASRRVASGDFNTKVFLKSKDELTELADSFNYMTEQIKTLFAKLSTQKEELNSIISSMQEGLLVLNEEEKIVLANESFKEIVSNDAVEDKFYWEVLREPQFGDMIKNVRGEKTNRAREINFDDKTYLCSATFLKSEREIVVVFHDLTEIKRVEKMKKDFIVNVSHELKTPLTAIKGFVETLENEADEAAFHYLGIVKRNTERLINIVSDLLVLSDLEERGNRFEFSEVDIKKLIKNVVKLFEPKAKEKNLDLNVKIENGLPLIKADLFKLEQMFINLIDNAVKYTEKGYINIKAKRVQQNILFTIEDSGIGVSENHLQRIFERFYVVNKSRSKALGGTGLGLSIVKHIILQHNGNIEIESSPGKGTRFSIALPITPA